MDFASPRANDATGTPKLRVISVPIPIQNAIGSKGTPRASPPPLPGIQQHQQSATESGSSTPCSSSSLDDFPSPQTLSPPPVSSILQSKSPSPPSSSPNLMRSISFVNPPSHPPPPPPLSVPLSGNRSTSAASLSPHPAGQLLSTSPTSGASINAGRPLPQVPSSPRSLRALPQTPTSPRAHPRGPSGLSVSGPLVVSSSMLAEVAAMTTSASTPPPSTPPPTPPTPTTPRTPRAVMHTQHNNNEVFKSDNKTTTNDTETTPSSTPSSTPRDNLAILASLPPLPVPVFRTLPTSSPSSSGPSTPTGSAISIAPSTSTSTSTPLSTVSPPPQIPVPPPPPRPPLVSSVSRSALPPTKPPPTPPSLLQGRPIAKSGSSASLHHRSDSSSSILESSLQFKNNAAIQTRPTSSTCGAGALPKPFRSTSSPSKTTDLETAQMAASKAIIASGLRSSSGNEKKGGSGIGGKIRKNDSAVVFESSDGNGKDADAKAKIRINPTPRYLPGRYQELEFNTRHSAKDSHPPIDSEVTSTNSALAHLITSSLEQQGRKKTFTFTQSSGGVKKKDVGGVSLLAALNLSSNSRRNKDETSLAPSPWIVDEDELDRGTDSWTSPQRTNEKWPQETEQNRSPLIELVKDYNVECSANINSKTVASSLEYIELRDQYVYFYTEYMHDLPHSHFLAEDETHGPMILTVVKNKSKDVKRLRVLLRTKKASERFWIPNLGSTVRGIVAAKPELADVKWRKSASIDLEEALTKFEKQGVSRKLKFGVLYCRPGQTEENDWYNNNEPSADFEEFLDFLGERVTLEGWKSFRGGLDVKTNSTGNQSIYTQFNGFEIMFHVSTLLPFSPSDPQQLERKRHLGNDIIVIIFRDAGCTDRFVPTQVRSQFNHVFLVVQKEVVASKPSKTYYRLGLTTKSGLQPFSPYLTDNGLYEKNGRLRMTLLSKLVNGERAALDCAEFRTKMVGTRKQLLQSIVENCRKNSKSTGSGKKKKSMIERPSS